MKLYTADHVIVGDGHVIRYGGVLVDDDVIAAVGRVSELPDVSDRVAFPTGTLLPGLIDTHVHLGFDGGPDPVAQLLGATDEQRLRAMIRAAADLLSAGVTTARDLGSPALLGLHLRDAIARGRLPGPRLVVAARPLTSVRGHCWYLGGECAGVDELRGLVRRQHDAGADVVKVMVTGGNTTAGSLPWQPQFTGHELAAVVDEAHGLGQPVAAHVHGTEGIRLAVDCGVDTLEHCTWQTERGFDGYEPAVADAIAAGDIPVCATFNPQLTTRPEFAETRHRVVTDMRSRGVWFVAGTDAGVVGTPHRGYAAGLQAMAHYGFTTAEVLGSATLGAAEVLGLADVTGSLVPGKDADLVVVAENPLTDLGALATPELVVARGRESRP